MRSVLLSALCAASAVPGTWLVIGVVHCWPLGVQLAVVGILLALAVLAVIGVMVGAGPAPDAPLDE